MHTFIIFKEEFKRNYKNRACVPYKTQIYLRHDFSEGIKSLKKLSQPATSHNYEGIVRSKQQNSQHLG